MKIRMTHDTLRKLALIILFLGVLGGVGIYLFPLGPKRAVISVEIPPSVAVGQTITIPLFSDTQGYRINAAEISMHYDPNVIRVDSVASDGSFFTLWISGEPRFSQATGEISFAGGLPTPGFQGRGQIGTLSLTLLKPQPAKLTFDPKTRILLNDGAGTAVPLTMAPVVISPR